MEAVLHPVGDVPLEVAVKLCAAAIVQRPCRIAFAGRAGAGKSTVATLLANEILLKNDKVDIFNHADMIKEEILEWLVDAVLQGFDPESDQCFEHFANFMGISPARIQDDLWDLIGPVYAEFCRLFLVATKNKWPLAEFAMKGPGVDIKEKVAFVDSHKGLFRRAMQLYSEMSKELTADEYYWVNMTVSRSLATYMCFNADTRWKSELDVLKNCAWKTIYLDISDETQKKRRPEMTDLERSHSSEWSIEPKDCDLVVDSNESLSSVIMHIAEYFLSFPASKKVREYGFVA